MSEVIDLMTKRFRIRPITPDKVSEDWLRWTRDPVMMAQLNARPAKVTRTDLQRYVDVSWKNKRAILGIYGRTSGDHIGLYEGVIDPGNDNVTLDVMIDQQRYGLSNVLAETDPVLLKFLATKRGIYKAIAQIMETYTPAIRHYEATGWLKEGVLRKEHPAASGNGRVDVVQFGRILDEFRS